MQKSHFIFLIKGELVVPQSLSEPGAGEIIRSVLDECFYISHIHSFAIDNKDAMNKFESVKNSYPAERFLEATIC